MNLLASRTFCLALLFLVTGAAGCRELAEKEAGDKMSQAESALLAEKWEEADDLFYSALLYDPERAEAWIGRGMTLTQLGDEEGAREHYQQALKLTEERMENDALAPELLRGKIMLLVLLNRSGEAIAFASDAARAHPNRRFARELVDLVQHIEREFEEMILPADEEEIAAAAPPATVVQEN